jgi:hypothetical protein
MANIFNLNLELYRAEDEFFALRFMQYQQNEEDEEREVRNSLYNLFEICSKYVYKIWSFRLRTGSKEV